jgi:hypothetical protein
MTSCRKKVIVYFGLIAVAAVLFVPYRERRVTSQSYSSVLVRRVTTDGRGFMPLPRFLKLRGRTVSETTGAELWISLNARLIKGEAAAIIILGLLDFFFVCGWKRKKRL